MVTEKVKIDKAETTSTYTKASNTEIDTRTTSKTKDTAT